MKMKIYLGPFSSKQSKFIRLNIGVLETDCQDIGTLRASMHFGQNNTLIVTLDKHNGTKFSRHSTQFNQYHAQIAFNHTNVHFKSRIGLNTAWLDAERRGNKIIIQIPNGLKLSRTAVNKEDAVYIRTRKSILTSGKTSGIPDDEFEIDEIETVHTTSFINIEYKKEFVFLNNIVNYKNGKFVLRSDNTIGILNIELDTFENEARDRINVGILTKALNVRLNNNTLSY